MTVVPIRDIDRRLPQAGRIRIGQKGPKGEPQAIDRFRFTAPGRAPLDAIAEMYGGTPRPWAEARSNDAFELFSEASEIEVVLPPDPYEANYEMWSGQGNQRRCDGITCQLRIPGADGPEIAERSCMCAERGVMECKLKQRLNVILPDISFFGFWRLDSSSKIAAEELPGIVDAIMAMDGGRSMTRAILRVERRSHKVATKSGPRTKRYVVPVLGFAATLNEIAAGAARVSASVGAAPPVGPPTGPGPRALSPGAGGYDDDHVVIDAEVIDDEVPVEEISEWLALMSARDRTRILRQARELADGLGEPIPANFEAITGRVLEAIWRGLNT